ncbi:MULTISPECIES: DsbA family oxidoreductase [unclassified Avibacterium]|uniref:DsbA family oxidoreductase n=1 Tax=unclassified Avibacterium TaxID=2685287 RepID=UPI00202724BE|nr:MULTISPECIES: DsbA family oxidoreductase [unclassified Avibacterium]MCW9699131.1 DsbA family oxidoreductase [Avibacterium sp. 20-129]URL06679.1 DsbA family oxidoreductase [Avibacterium sp. 21-595]
MQITLFSDYACPFCYIGKRYLEQALAQFEHADQVQIHHKAFELYPQAGKTVTNTTQGRIEWKYQKSPSDALAMIRGIEQKANLAGINMRYAEAQNTNMFDAHRLTKLATTLGKEEQMAERLFAAYFTDSLILADHETLCRLAEEVGIERSRVEQMLASDEFAEAVRADETAAQQKGVHAVPYFEVDGIPINGALPASHFLAVLQDAWQQQNQQAIEGASCGVDGCH